MVGQIYCCCCLLPGLACSIHATWGPPFSPAAAATPASAAAAAEGVLQRQLRLIKLLNPYHQKSAPQLGCETSYIQVRDYADQPINQRIDTCGDFFTYLG